MSNAVMKVRRGSARKNGLQRTNFGPPMFLKRLAYYLNPKSLFGKSSENSSLRFMHGINRISILLFMFCLVVMVVRAMSR
jgi:hypothetical protein